jgi:hypothetical protein
MPHSPGLAVPGQRPPRRHPLANAGHRPAIVALQRPLDGPVHIANLLAGRLGYALLGQHGPDNLGCRQRGRSLAQNVQGGGNTPRA